MKKFFICLLMGAMAAGAGAQGLRYGVEGGLNVSSPMNADGTKCGFNIGATAEYGFQSECFVSGALKLSSKPFKAKQGYVAGDFDGSDTGAVDVCVEMTPYYLNIPIHAGYRMGLGDNVKLSVSAGPYLGVGLWGKGTGTVKVSGDVPSDLDIKAGKYKVDNVFKDSDLRRFEIGASVKAGLEFKDRYRLSVGYDIQLNSMMKDDDYYNQVVSVSVGYMF